ncbi:MAG: hypothetical protein OEW62_05930 [Candidatus Bathyarchaeota archaeon]|nr:hypothetical protein [Candidatus Bathyarchaeota archaeon]
MENLPERLRTSGATEIRKKLQGISGGKILDVATGFGDFIKLIKEVRGCSLEDAEQLQEKWLDEGLVAYDQEGLLQWVR